MIGSSRESLANARRGLDARVGSADFERLAPELRAVAKLLGEQSQLRGTLCDSGIAASARGGLVQQLLGGQVSALAVEVVTAVVSERWSTGGDLVDALELLGAEAAFAVAEQQGRLDTIEDQLFAVGRAVDASPELQMALTDVALPDERKLALLADLLADRSEPEVLDAVSQIVVNPRGRRLVSALDALVEVATVRRQQLLAVVTVARSLDLDQRDRLAAALGRIYQRTITIQEVVDTAVVGGVRVEIAGEIIDGTTLHRLEQARRLVG